MRVSDANDPDQVTPPTFSGLRGTGTNLWYGDFFSGTTGFADVVLADGVPLPQLSVR